MINRTFFTTLFMSIVGIIFFIIALVPIIFNVYKFIEKNHIINNGIQTTATITYKSIDDYNSNYSRHDNRSLTISYRIKYTVNNTDYSYSCISANRSYKEDDIIYIHCLTDNPEKVVVPLEKGTSLLQIIIVCPIFLLLGISCIKHYNIFSYKKYY